MEKITKTSQVCPSLATALKCQGLYDRGPTYTKGCWVLKVNVSLCVFMCKSVYLEESEINLCLIISSCYQPHSSLCKVGQWNAPQKWITQNKSQTNQFQLCVTPFSSLNPISSPLSRISPSPAVSTAWSTYLSAESPKMPERKDMSLKSSQRL